MFKRCRPPFQTASLSLLVSAKRFKVTQALRRHPAAGAPGMQPQGATARQRAIRAGFAAGQMQRPRERQPVLDAASVQLHQGLSDERFDLDRVAAAFQQRYAAK